MKTLKRARTLDCFECHKFGQTQQQQQHRDNVHHSLRRKKNRIQCAAQKKSQNHKLWLTLRVGVVYVCSHEVRLCCLRYLYHLRALFWWWFQCPQESVIIVNYSICVFIHSPLSVKLCVCAIVQWIHLCCTRAAMQLLSSCLTYGLPTFHQSQSFAMQCKVSESFQASKIASIWPILCESVLCIAHRLASANMCTTTWGITDNLKTLQIH